MHAPWNFFDLNFRLVGTGTDADADDGGILAS
jgi:hypothetical protein